MMCNSCFLLQGFVNSGHIWKHINHRAQRLLTSNVLQGDCDTSSHFSWSAKGSEPQLFICSNPCKHIITQWSSLRSVCWDIPLSNTIRFPQNFKLKKGWTSVMVGYCNFLIYIILSFISALNFMKSCQLNYDFLLFCCIECKPIHLKVLESKTLYYCNSQNSCSSLLKQSE